MLDRTIHREKLIQLLLEIYNDRFLMPLLGFKGGTAVYLFHGLTRFSVDLDFDLLDKTKENEVHNKILGYANSLGLIRDEAIKFYGGIVVCSYQSELQNLKIEISNRDSVSEYEMKSLLGVPIRVMVKEDMFSNKLLALYERMAVRDIFDVHFMFKNNWAYNPRVISNRFPDALEQFLAILIEKLEAFDDKLVLADLGHLLSGEQKNWVKNKMKQDTLMCLKIHLDSLMHRKC